MLLEKDDVVSSKNTGMCHPSNVKIALFWHKSIDEKNRPHKKTQSSKLVFGDYAILPSGGVA